MRTATGVRLVPCRRPWCSEGCRRRWAQRLSACLRRSFTEGSPPTHFARVTAFGRLSRGELSRAQQSLLRRLTYREIGFFWVREWGADGQEHLHLLLRTQGNLTTEQFGTLWRQSLPALEGVHGTHYCQALKNAVGAARYVVKDTRAGGELALRGLRRRLYGYSTGFLSRPLRELWAAVRADWFGEEG
jgi:hypothetical protein